MSAFLNWSYRVAYLYNFIRTSNDALARWGGEWDGKDGAW